MVVPFSLRQFEAEPEIKAVWIAFLQRANPNAFALRVSLGKHNAKNKLAPPITADYKLTLLSLTEREIHGVLDSLRHCTYSFWTWQPHGIS